MSTASEVELMMLDLINEERTSRGLDQLAINDALNDASEDHSAWMLDTDNFSHTGVGGSSATQRIERADYDLDGTWLTAENIAFQSERGAPGIEDDVRDIHDSLMASPGHRANILNPDAEDIGIGIEVGDFDGFDAVMVTQNFGATDAVMDAPLPEPAPDPDPEVPVAQVDLSDAVETVETVEAEAPDAADDRLTDPVKVAADNATGTNTDDDDAMFATLDDFFDFWRLDISDTTQTANGWAVTFDLDADTAGDRPANDETFALASDLLDGLADMICGDFANFEFA